MQIMISLRRLIAALAIASLTVGSRGDDTAPAPAEPAAAGTLTDFTRWVIAADYAADGKLLLTAGGESLLYRSGGDHPAGEIGQCVGGSGLRRGRCGVIAAAANS